MKIKNLVSGLFNTAIVASMVAVGVHSVSEARANERLDTISQEDRLCLAQNIFFEARNQSVAGQVAVAWVTLNRMESPLYPNTICAVVKQANLDSSGNPIRNQCHFSWYCDGKSDRIPKNEIAQEAWAKAKLISEVVLLDWARLKPSPVKDAIMYHANYTTPYWASQYTPVTRIDGHIFYQ